MGERGQRPNCVGGRGEDGIQGQSREQSSSEWAPAGWGRKEDRCMPLKSCWPPGSSCFPTLASEDLQLLTGMHGERSWAPFSPSGSSWLSSPWGQASATPHAQVTALPWPQTQPFQGPPDKVTKCEG
jgi:hypothetical protein